MSEDEEGIGKRVVSEENYLDKKEREISKKKKRRVISMVSG